jgi:hypothetical protein
MNLVGNADERAAQNVMETVFIPRNRICACQLLYKLVHVRLLYYAKPFYGKRTKRQKHSPGELDPAVARQ